MLVPSPAVPSSLRRERTQRAANIPFAQSLQSTVAKLSDTLACDTKQRSDFLESVLPPALETKVQP